MDFSRILTRTTQPAHAVLFAGVLVVASSLMPGQSGSTKSTSSALLYLACFAAHFGAQLWMTFVSGNDWFLLISNKRLNKMGFVRRTFSVLFAAPTQLRSSAESFVSSVLCPQRRSQHGNPAGICKAAPGECLGHHINVTGQQISYSYLNIFFNFPL